MRILLLGGSKSGKSGYAQELVSRLARGGVKYYWATMEPADNEDEARIAKHLEDRAGMGFSTIERGRNVQGYQGSLEGASVLFDSVTALLANEMFGSEFDAAAPERVAEELSELSKRCENFVCVCDRLFEGGEEYGDWTENYVRGLASICRRSASEFDAMLEVVCGIPRFIKGEAHARLL